MSKFQTKLLMIFAIGMFFISLASAQPPAFQFSTGEQSYNIFVNDFQTMKQNSDYTIHIHVENFSTSLVLQNSEVDCYAHLYNSSGGETFISGVLDKSADGIDHELYISSGNHSDLGLHHMKIWCNSSAFSGTKEVYYEVTPTGEEATTSKAVFYLGILVLLIVLFIVSLYSFNEAEQIWTKTGSLGFAYLVFTSITFIAWNMAANFMTTSTFVISFLRIIFLVMTIGFFPFLIGLFAYGIWMMVQIQEIKKLQDQGFSLEEASEKVKRRKM